MDLSLDEEREQARNALRQLLASAGSSESDATGDSESLWNRLRDEGRLATGPLSDLIVRFEEFGRAAAPGPLLSHFESLLLLEACGVDDPVPLTSLALLEASGSPDLATLELSCDRRASGYVLSGTKLFVPWADIASQLLVVARNRDGLAVLRIDAAATGITRRALDTLGPERSFEVHFDAVAADEHALLLDDAGNAIEDARARATLLACADLAGSARAAVETAVQHARTREQFGQPIGAFQAIAHHCADMAMDADAAELAVRDAAARVDAGEPAALHAARAKIVCGEAARRVTSTAHQVMGGIGFLADGGLAAWTQRVKALESRLGTPDWHRERLADALGL